MPAFGQPALQFGARHVRVAAAARRGPDVDDYSHLGAPEQLGHPLGRGGPVPERQQHVTAILRGPARPS